MNTENTDNTDVTDNNAKGCHNHNHSPKKHILHMIICCGLPILIILALPLIASINSGVAAILGVIAPFICPVMMGGMMFMMFKGNKHGKETNTQKEMMLSEKESRRF